MEARGAMSRQIRTEAIKGFLAINALLREELAAIRGALARRAKERKYNPNWPSQPRAPRGTTEGGQWVRVGGGGGGRTGAFKIGGGAPKGGSTRTPGRGHNRPPVDSLFEIFPGLPTAPASAILAPIDGLLGITGPGVAANEAATRNLADSLIREIQSLDPSYVPPAFAEPGGFPRTINGRNNYIDALRADRAAAIYRTRGDYRPLQVETLRFIRRRIDSAYANATSLFEAGRLPTHLTREVAIGNQMDWQLRQELRDFYNSLRIPWGPGRQVRVVGREYNRSGTDITYRVPDARVGNVAFDWTLFRKTPGNAQIRGFFNSDWRPDVVVIVRPRQIRTDTLYAMTRPGE
jgi:hypothetical protein